MKRETGDEATVGGKTVRLHATHAELLARAAKRLMRKGVGSITEWGDAVFGPGFSPGYVVRNLTASFSYRDPYIVCRLRGDDLLASLGLVEALGVAKRNPRDRRNLAVGATLAAYRAWRDLLVQMAEKEAQGAEARTVREMAVPPVRCMETLDSIRPERWREMTAEERLTFTDYWMRRGFMSYSCLSCGFPTAHGQGSCEACRLKPAPAQASEHVAEVPF